MRAWTPTTEMVRQLYVSGREARSPAETLRMHPDEIAAEFDRWLASLREPGARVATTCEDDAS